MLPSSEACGLLGVILYHCVHFVDHLTQYKCQFLIYQKYRVESHAEVSLTVCEKWRFYSTVETWNIFNKFWRNRFYYFTNVTVILEYQTFWRNIEKIGIPK